LFRNGPGDDLRAFFPLISLYKNKAAVLDIL